MIFLLFSVLKWFLKWFCRPIQIISRRSPCKLVFSRGRGSLVTVSLCPDLMGAGEKVLLISQLPWSHYILLSWEGEMEICALLNGKSGMNWRKFKWLYFSCLFLPYMYVSEINVYLICTRACSGQSVYDLRKGEWDSTISWSCIILGSSQVLPMEDCGKLLPWWVFWQEQGERTREK